MTKTVYNFSAGPSVLPESALKAAAAACIDYKNTGISLMCMSHRTKPVMEMFTETEALVRELLAVPANYKVLFLGGGASLQFAMAPMNLLPQDGIADYTDTGEWGAKAAKEAKLFGKVNIAGSSKEANYTFLPKQLNQTANAVYLHLTSNNTVFGSQWKTLPTPVNPNGYQVIDASSDIFSRPIDWTRVGLLYAGAQKNAGPAGVCLAIIREDILGKSGRTISSMLDYAIHIKGESMFNTPPVFPVYVMNETLKWLKSVGGVAGVQAINERKAAKLYAEIDRNPMFTGTVTKEDRSTMNVVFIFDAKVVTPEAKEAKEKEFLAFAKERGLETLAGHRIVGGFRASIYNAMPEAGVDTLIAAMQDFSKKNGVE